MAQTTGKFLDVSVAGVLACHIEHVWPKVWPHLQKAIARFPEVLQPYTEERILELVLSRRGQIWVAWDTDKDECLAAVLTEITNPARYPGRRFLEIPLVGGVRFAEWGGALFKLLCAFGRSHDCDAVVGYGRRGWQRKLGFIAFGTTDDGIPRMYRPLMET